MWFLGVIAGVLLGAMAGSGAVAVLFAVIGGVLFNAMWGNKRDAASSPEPGAQDSAGTQPYSVERTPSQRISDLEERVLGLEDALQSLQGVQNTSDPVAGSTAQPPSAQAAQKYVPQHRNEVAVASPQATVQTAVSDESSHAEYKGPDTVPLPYPAQDAPDDAWGAQPQQTKPTAVPWRERLPRPVADFLFGGNSLVRLGALVLFLGLAFLLRYAAERVTVPVEMRYAGVASVGLALLALGWVLRRKRADYAQVLQGAGIAVIYLTTLAGMKWHGLVPPTAGFVFLAVVAVLAAMLAVLQNAYPLAVAAAVGGFAAPVLASTGGGQPLPLFIYLALLDSGIFLVAWFRAWRGLNLIGFVSTAALAGAWAQRHYVPEHDSVLQIFLIFFFLLFTSVGLLFARRTLAQSPPDDHASLGERARQSVVTVGRVDSALAFGVPMAAFGLEYGLTRQWEFGPAIAAMVFSFFYLVLARLVISFGQRGLSLLAEAYVVMGVIFLTLSIPLGLEGLWTGAAWAVEGAGMYWLGVRQQRPYARALAFVVMAGATWKLLQDIRIVAEPGGSLLEGSVLGPLLLAASAFVMWVLHRRAKLPDKAEASALSDSELFVASLMPWLGWAALVLLPWQWWAPQAAAAATAGLSVLAFALGTARKLREFQPIVLALQGVALMGFLFTLHRVAGAGATEPLLDSGPNGMLYPLVIALCMMLTSGWRMLAIRRRAIDQQVQPDWAVSGSLVLVTAVLLLHLSTLFVVGVADAGWLWPMTGLAVLGVALHMAHTPLALLAVALQLISALMHLFAPLASPVQGVDVFANAYFGRALSLGVCGLLAAWWISLAARRVQAGQRWVCSWAASRAALWWPLLWGLLWWFLAWLIETSEFAVAPRGPGASMMPALHGLVVLATSALLAGMALVLGWRQAGVATAFTLPGLALVALELVQRFGFDFVPLAHWGAWVWPAALAWHFLLLRRQADWLAPSTMRVFHLAGFWLFLLLAARECQWRIGGDSELATSWSMLGWVLVPALVLVLMRSRVISRYWPLPEFEALYRETACIPVALYLLAWLWVGNALSSGSAAPLPYLPLLNPLELGQWLVLAALALWWRDLSAQARSHLPPAAVPSALALTALALLTGAVLRSCHHYAGVDWTADAMMHSRVAQAALSVAWALCAVATMVISNRILSRQIWLAGSVLMGAVVVKLFLVDLADRGGLYRIVSFMAVGALLLLVGYFAPVPPTLKAAARDDSPGKGLDGVR